MQYFLNRYIEWVSLFNSQFLKIIHVVENHKALKFELFLFSPLLPHLLHFDFQVRKDKLLLRVYNFSYGFCGCWKTENALGTILARPTKNVNFSTAHMNNNVESSSKPPKMATTSFSTSHLFNWAYTIQCILVTYLEISLLAKKRWLPVWTEMCGRTSGLIISFKTSRTTV